MFYLFSGNNFEKRKKAFETELKRFSDFDKIYISSNDFSNSLIESYINSQSLFGTSSAVILDSVLEDETNQSLVFKKVKELELSQNVFFFLETSINKTDLKKIEKKVKNIFIFDEIAKKEQKFNVFSLTDSFNSRDKKNTWVLMQKALKSDVPAMDIANILTWSIKSLILAKDKKGTDEEIKKTGLNPFVFKKALSFSKKWDMKDMKKALQNIVFLYHDDRRGEDLTRDLELFLLKTL